MVCYPISKAIDKLPIRINSCLEVSVRKNKIIGILLLIFTVYTIVGMVIKNNAYWAIYNYVTIIFSVLSGIVLLKEK